MGFEIDINLKDFCEISNRKNYDHCWRKNKTMLLLCDNVIIKLVLVIQCKMSQKSYPESTPICHLPLAATTDSMMFSCLAGDSSM